MQLTLWEFIFLAQNYLANTAEQKRAIGALQDVKIQPCSQSEREAHFWEVGSPSWCRTISLKQDPQVLWAWHFAFASYSWWPEAIACRWLTRLQSGWFGYLFGKENFPNFASNDTVPRDILVGESWIQWSGELVLLLSLPTVALINQIWTILCKWPCY